eukprot:TRINITY_DN421_c1_g1_i1.p2 TRINITY_DN421_c1_g1~~TRINITY_DN421_c1_g1_i1.p2  ORF type:complete len:450 (+),score=77.16 TRINITY_DN421_c1_g1_i1:1077-2426(+)
MNQEFDFLSFEDAVARASSMLDGADVVLADIAGEDVPVSALSEVTSALFDFLRQAISLNDAYKVHSHSVEEHLSKLHSLEKKIKTAHAKEERVNKKIKDMEKKLHRAETRLRMLQQPMPADEIRHEEEVQFLRTVPSSRSEYLPPTEECRYDETNSSVDSWPLEYSSLIESPPPESQESTTSSGFPADSDTDLCHSTPLSDESQKAEPWLISYVHSGRESAMSGRPESPFVREYNHKGTVTMQIREAAYAQMFKNDVLVNSKFSVEEPFQLDNKGAPCFTYVGFRYIDDTTLPFIPLKNVRLLYENVNRDVYYKEMNERPGRSGYAQTHIWVELEKRVFNTIVDMSINAFREGQKEHESDVVASGPQIVDSPAWGVVRMLVHMSPESYVRVAEEREDVPIGLISSVMYDRKSDIVGDGTFLLRFARFDDGVPVLCFKLHGIKVNSAEYE